MFVQQLPAEDGGGFVATVPDLPGCISDGETPEEAGHLVPAPSSTLRPAV